MQHSITSITILSHDIFQFYTTRELYSCIKPFQIKEAVTAGTDELVLQGLINISIYFNIIIFYTTICMNIFNKSVELLGSLKKHLTIKTSESIIF